MATKTEQIFELTTPYDNKFQGPSKRYLFVCSAGILRSPTAAAVAIKEGYNARSCGSHHGFALIPISVNLVYWAHKIFFMNKENYDRALQNFFGDNETLSLIKEKAIIWSIEDDYNYMQSELVNIVEKLLP